MAIVESKKAACILSRCNPYFTWIASGGSSGLNQMINKGYITRYGSVLELFYKDLYQLYDLKDILEHEGIDNYPLSSLSSFRLSDNSLLQTRS